MKHARPSLRMLAFMTVLTGIAYPLLITVIGSSLYHEQSTGSLVKSEGTVIGSQLIAQNFESPKYFWPRPSSISFNPLPSGGSNLGPTSSDLKKSFDERRANLKRSNPDSGEPPQDLLFASGSGLDPEISPEAATYQVARVAKARALTDEQVENIVARLLEGRQLGLFGEPRVNVLALNVALDRMQRIKIAPTYARPPTSPTKPDLPAGGN